MSRGVVSIDEAPGRSVTYGELLGEKPFKSGSPGRRRRSPSQYRLVGTNVPASIFPPKVRAQYTHMQHMRVPGMLHGRAVLPRGQARVRRACEDR